jgi:hypothetical protein
VVFVSGYRLAFSNLKSAVAFVFYECFSELVPCVLVPEERTTILDESRNNISVTCVCQDTYCV